MYLQVSYKVISNVNGSSSKDSPTLEIQQLAKEVSGFFGNIFKEFKTISSGTASKVDEFVHNHLKSQKPPSRSSASNSNANANTTEQAQETSRAEQEEFELQMALAMSLSLQEEIKIDPEIVLDLEKSGLNVDKMLLEDET